MTRFDPGSSLADHFLVAMPSLQDPFFGGSVVYLLQHNEQGAFGLVINHPIDKLSLRDVFGQLDIEDARPPLSPQVVLAGGPVERDKGFVLHDAPALWPSSLVLREGLTLTTSKDILQAIGGNTGPKRYCVALGCSGWSPGQLEQELRENAWFTCPAREDILFSADFTSMARRVAASLGFELSQLTSEIGYS